MRFPSRRAFLRACLSSSLGGLAAACGSSTGVPVPTGAPTSTDVPLSAPTATLVPTLEPTSMPTLVPPPVLPEEDRALGAVTGLKQVARLTGDPSINNTHEQWAVHGTDLGSMFDKDGKLYMVFGDSFGCCVPGTGGPGSAGDWRYNLLAVSSDRDPSDGLTFDEMITDRPGHAKQLLSKRSGDTTVIPTYGVAVGSRMFLHYMGVQTWGKPGEWTLSESGLAYSDDDGQTWVKDEQAKWDGESNFGQVAFVKTEQEVYLLGIPGGRFGGVQLARVGQDDLLDKAAYRYYAGQEGTEPRWSADEGEAVTVVPAPVGELSVIWNAYLDRWIMTYLDEKQAALVIREAPELWGPWSPALTLVSGRQYPGLYGAYMHPWYVENDGQAIYFAMSQWGPYNVLWMRAELVKA